MRNEQIDILKGIGIISVVYYHCNLWGGYVVSCFMLPIFFFISGWLWKERSFKEFIIRKIKALYVPFVIISLFYLSIRNFLFGIGVYNVNSGLEPLTSVGNVLNNLFHIFLFDVSDSLLEPLWFLPALFGSNLLFFVLHKLLKKTKLLILSGGILFALGNILTYFEIKINASYHCKEIINVCMVAVLFVIAGYICKKKEIYKYFNKMPVIFQKIPVVETILAIILLVFCYSFKLRIDMRINQYSSVPGFLICSMSGILLIALFAYRIRYITLIKTIVTDCGKYSFEIMTFHFSAFKIVSAFLIYILHIDFSLLGYRIIPNLPKYIMIAYFIFGMLISYCIGLGTLKIKNKVKTLTDRRI